MNSKNEEIVLLSRSIFSFLLNAPSECTASSCYDENRISPRFRTIDGLLSSERSFAYVVTYTDIIIYIQGSSITSIIDFFFPNLLQRNDNSINFALFFFLYFVFFRTWGVIIIIMPIHSCPILILRKSPIVPASIDFDFFFSRSSDVDGVCPVRREEVK